MARIIPQDIKWVDVVYRVTEDKQLVLCADCQEDMMVVSSIQASAVDDPSLFTLTHNLICPNCKGKGLISLRSK